jgi:hypothetical protein
MSVVINCPAKDLPFDYGKQKNNQKKNPRNGRGVAHLVPLEGIVEEVVNDGGG